MVSNLLESKFYREISRPTSSFTCQVFPNRVDVGALHVHLPHHSELDTKLTGHQCCNLQDWKVRNNSEKVKSKLPPLQSQVLGLQTGCKENLNPMFTFPSGMGWDRLMGTGEWRQREVCQIILTSWNICFRKNFNMHWWEKLPVDWTSLLPVDL